MLTYSDKWCIFIYMSRKKSDSVSISIRLPRYLHEQLTLMAKIETRSISQQVVHFLKQAVGNELGIEEKGNNGEIR